MRVLFDLQIFAEQAHGGVSRYFIELGRSLQERGSWIPVVPPGFHVSADDRLRSFDGGPLIRGTRRGFRLKRQVNRVMSVATRRRAIADVIHPTWYHRPSIEVWGDRPLVLTVHDLIPELVPDVTSPEELDHRAWAIARARVILCVSEATRDALLERFPGASGRTLVAYPGLTPLPDPSAAGGPSDPYFVFVGKRGSYKDFSTLLRALEAVRQPLIAVGGGRPSSGTLGAIDKAGLGDLVTFLPHPTDQELAGLLSGATALVSASRYEGFGIPPLEALSLGTPVVLSDIPVYREIYGKWGTFFDPGDPDDLADKMIRVLEGRFTVPPRHELASKYSWSETAAVAERAYEQAME